MSIRTRSLTLTLCVLAVGLALDCGLASAQLVEGKDYRTVNPPQPTSSPGKIEVVEFFSYACPHCSAFYPLLTAWLAKQPKDIAFKRVPVGFGRTGWVNLARTYYALEATGELSKLDGALFRAIHVEHLPLFDEANIDTWVGKNGGDADKFATAYTSFGVNNSTVQADQMVESFGITGIPALTVDGKYVMLTPDEAADEQAEFTQLLANTDRMLARVRAERHTAAPHAGAAKSKK